MLRGSSGTRCECGNPGAGARRDLSVAHALAAGPRSSAEFACERGVDAEALQRVLRALASDGITALDASGQPSFSRVHGDDFWTWLATHPKERAALDRAMAPGWRSRLNQLQSIDWRGDEVVVDVGGGNGSLPVARLERHPGLLGIVFDLPDGARRTDAR